VGLGERPSVQRDPSSLRAAVRRKCGLRALERERAIHVFPIRNVNALLPAPAYDRDRAHEKFVIASKS
jgi:hypothetical protein